MHHQGQSRLQPDWANVQDIDQIMSYSAATWSEFRIVESISLYSHLSKVLPSTRTLLMHRALNVLMAMVVSRPAPAAETSQRKLEPRPNTVRIQSNYAA